MSNPRARLIEGDCKITMHSLDAASVDLVIADPPYKVTSLAWDRTVNGWLVEAGRVLKPTGSIWMFCSLRSLLAIQGELDGWLVAQEIVWEKQNGTGFHNDRFKRVHELCVQLYRPPWKPIYRDPQYTLDATKRTVRRKTRPPHMGHIEQGAYTSQDGGPRLMRSVLKIRNCHGSAIHPTQKPIDLLLPLIRYSCPPNGLVLDPFMGSGSTGIACLESNRSFIGIELDHKYYEAAEQRIALAQRLAA